MATKTYEFTMDMTCEACANAAKKVLGKKGDQVTKVVTDVDAKTVLVTSSLSPKELEETLQKTGKTIGYVGEK